MVQLYFPDGDLNLNSVKYNSVGVGNTRFLSWSWSCEKIDDEVGARSRERTMTKLVIGVVKSPRSDSERSLAVFESGGYQDTYSIKFCFGTAIFNSRKMCILTKVKKMTSICITGALKTTLSEALN